MSVVTCLHVIIFHDTRIDCITHIVGSGFFVPSMLRATDMDQTWHLHLGHQKSGRIPEFNDNGAEEKGRDEKGVYCLEQPADNCLQSVEQR